MSTLQKLSPGGQRKPFAPLDQNPCEELCKAPCKGTTKLDASIFPSSSSSFPSFYSSSTYPSYSKDSGSTVDPATPEKPRTIYKYPPIPAYRTAHYLYHNTFHDKRKFGRYNVLSDSACETRNQATLPVFIYNNSCIVFSAHRRKTRPTVLAPTQLEHDPCDSKFNAETDSERVQDESRDNLQVMASSEIYTIMLVAQKAWAMQEEQAKEKLAAGGIGIAQDEQSLEKSAIDKTGGKQDEQTILVTHGLENKQEEVPQEKSATDGMGSTLDESVADYRRSLQICHISVFSNDEVWVLRYHLPPSLFAEFEEFGKCRQVNCNISSYIEDGQCWRYPIEWVRDYVDDEVERVAKMSGLDDC